MKLLSSGIDFCQIHNQQLKPADTSIRWIVCVAFENWTSYYTISKIRCQTIGWKCNAYNAWVKTFNSFGIMRFNVSMQRIRFISWIYLLEPVSMMSLAKINLWLYYWSTWIKYAKFRFKIRQYKEVPELSYYFFNIIILYKTYTFIPTLISSGIPKLL